ncbi:MAG TPA: RDD family protein [Flavitalea sp.]|nr:RDD family protein [Flavitalea sp.]
MPLVKLDTGYNIEVEFVVAPFVQRLLAWTIDVFICWMLTKAIAVLLNTYSFFVWTNTWSIKGVFVSMPVLFYHLVSEITMNGRSAGKMLMKCRVVTEEGGQPGIGQYLIRWSFRLVDFPYWILIATVSGVMPWWTLPLVFTGIASIMLTQKSQRVGDIVAGTILIDTRNSTSWEDTVFTEISDHYKPRYPQVMQLSDRDINTLKNVIDTVKKNNDHDLANRIAQRIISKTKIETEEYAIDFLETLLLDYNYYSTR